MRLEQGAQIVVGVGVPGLDRDGSLIRRGRFLEPSALDEDISEVVVAARLGRVERDGALDQLDRRIAPVAMVQEHAEEVQGIRVVGDELEDTTVERFRVGELAVSMQLDRNGNRLRQGQFRGLRCLRVTLHLALFPGTERRRS